MRKMVAWETVSLLNARSKAKVEDVSKPTRTGEGRGKPRDNLRDKDANPISRPNRGAHRGSSKAKDKANARHKLRVLLSARQMLNSRGKAVLRVRVVPPTRPVPANGTC